MEVNLDKVSIRPLAPSDADYLLKWLSNPAVLEFYEGRDFQCTMEAVQEHFYASEPWMSRWIVTYNRGPVGYLQSYPVVGEMRTEYGFEGPEEAVYAIDQFIGEPEMWGRGIGRSFLRLILRWLEKEKGAEVILLDPHTDNARAIRAYLAVGFQAVKLLPAHELHEGTMRDCWLMAYYTDRRVLPGGILPLAGARNLRELGGIANRKGKRIRSGILYRSGALEGLSSADCEYLYRLGVRSVIDLRTAEEERNAPDALKGYRDVLVYPFPLLDGVFVPGEGEVTDGLPGMYCAMLDGLTSQPMIAELFRKLPELLEEGGALFHCTAGKDRTGVISMLLLELFGAEDRVIVENYSRSQELLEDPLKIQWRLERDYRRILPLSFFQSAPENAEAFLRHLREKYGSARGYLRNAGLKDEEIGRLVGMMGQD